MEIANAGKARGEVLQCKANICLELIWWIVIFARYAVQVIHTHCISGLILHSIPKRCSLILYLRLAFSNLLPASRISHCNCVLRRASMCNCYWGQSGSSGGQPQGLRPAKILWCGGNVQCKSLPNRATLLKCALTTGNGFCCGLCKASMTMSATWPGWRCNRQWQPPAFATLLAALYKLWAVHNWLLSYNAGCQTWQASPRDLPESSWEDRSTGRALCWIWGCLPGDGSNQACRFPKGSWCHSNARVRSSMYSTLQSILGHCITEQIRFLCCLESLRRTPPSGGWACGITIGISHSQLEVLYCIAIQKQCVLVWPALATAYMLDSGQSALHTFDDGAGIRNWCLRTAWTLTAAYCASSFLLQMFLFVM